MWAVKGCQTASTVYSPYTRRLESLTICGCNCKGSTFSSVILRPWVLVRPESNSRPPIVWFWGSPKISARDITTVHAGRRMEIENRDRETSGMWLSSHNNSSIHKRWFGFPLLYIIVVCFFSYFELRRRRQSKKFILDERPTYNKVWSYVHPNTLS